MKSSFLPSGSLRSRPARVERGRCPVVETLVQALMVVKTDIAFDARPRFGHRCVIFQVHLLLFERPPQPLDKNVVHTSSAAIHADCDLSGLKFTGELLTGEL